MRSSISFVVIALCIGMYFMYISPTISEVKALVAEKAQYTNVLDKSQELNVRRDQILAKYNSIPAEEMDKLGKIIPETFETEIFLNNINNLAANNGLKIRSIKTNSSKNDRNSVVSETAAPPAYKTNLTTITFSGGYGRFLDFLDDLESSLHLIDVKSITVRSASKDAKSGADNYDFEVGLMSYSIK